MTGMPIQGYGARSPDGLWWWDGGSWHPMPPQAVAASPGAASMPQGPPGQQRSVATCILLAIVTLGIYAIVWVYKTQQEIKRYSGIGVGGVLGLVIFILLSPVTYFLVPSEVRQLHETRGRRSPVQGTTGLWVLLPLAGSIVWFVKVQGALNAFWGSQGPAPGQAAYPQLMAPPAPPPV